MYDCRSSVFAAHRLIAWANTLERQSDMLYALQRAHFTDGIDIGSFLTYDLVYRLSLPAETTFTASVINLADKDPPFVRLDLGYDPFIANPYGRYFKVLLNKKF